jgi:hypothetical protein
VRAAALAAQAEAEAERARQQAIASDRAADLLRMQMQQQELQNSIQAQHLREQEKMRLLGAEEERRRQLMAQRMAGRDNAVRARAEQQQAALERRQRIMQQRVHIFAAGEPPLQQSIHNMFGALGGLMSGLGSVMNVPLHVSARGTSAFGSASYLPIQLGTTVDVVPGLLVDVSVGAQVDQLCVFVSLCH